MIGVRSLFIFKKTGFVSLSNLRNGFLGVHTPYIANSPRKIAKVMLARVPIR